MYGSIHELPSQVRNSLSQTDQKKFLKIYNDFDPKSEKETREALKKTWHACSKLPSAFTYEIVCGADIFDKDREMITVDSIKKNLDDFIAFGGPVQFEHGDYNIGTVYDWAPCKADGNVNAVKVYGAIYGNDDVSREARKKFKKGLNSLSVAGEASFGKHYCEDGKCGMRRDVKVLKEISLCTVPANRLCKMISSHEGEDSGFIKKSGSFINMPVIGFTINDNSEPLCPLRQLERDLHNIGYPDAHATHAGVRIKMENSAFAKAYPYMEKNGLHAVHVGDDVFLAPKEYLIEKSFKEGLEQGYVLPDGTLSGKITKSQFMALAERGVLDNTNGRFRIRKPGETDG